MLFPLSDKYWVDTANFVQDHIQPGDKLLAPDEFREKFTNHLSYSLNHREDPTNFQWVVIHKGMMETIDYAFLDRVIKDFIPVFANEVFVVLSNRKGLSKIRDNSVHIRAFKEKMKFQEIINKTLLPLIKKIERLENKVNNLYQSTTEQEVSQDSTPPISNYSDLSVTEIKELMEQRYDTQQAYNIEFLWDRIRAEELNRYTVEMLSSTDEKIILELGCGIGGSASLISECKEFIGTDLSESAIAQANLAYKDRQNFRFMAMDATNLTFEDNKFDIVIAREVIEHLLNPGDCIKEVFRVLKPNGQFIVTSPNRDSLHLRVNRMLGHSDFKCSFDHIQEFTFQEAAEMLKEEGFEIKKTAGAFLMPYWGIAGIDSYVRNLTDNDPKMVEVLRDLGERVGADYAFCFVILCVKPE